MCGGLSCRFRCQRVELPFMIVDFMKKADIKTDYFFFILTCGYGYEVSLGHAEVAARERGWAGIRKH